MSQQCFTADEVAVILKVRPERVRELLRRGMIPAIRMGRQWRVDPNQFQEWMANGGHGLTKE